MATYLRKPFQEGQSIFNKVGYGTQDLLLINDGNNGFIDATTAAGLTYIHNSFQAAFADIDGDADMDIIVAHDTGTVKTWRNNGDLTFTDMPNPTSDKFAYPMGIAVGDYNRDGKVDFAFSNIGDMGPMTFMVRGDLTKDQVLNDQLILLENKGDFVFEDSAAAMHFGDYEFSWGLVMADFNNDTKEDIVLAQNYVALPPYKLFRSPSRFLLQGQDGFESVDHLTGTTNRQFSISPLFADFNQDGALDLILVNLGTAPRAFINEAPITPFIGIRLPDTVASLGCNVTVVTDKGRFTKTLYSPQGLGADSTHTMLLSLPGATAIEKILITSLTGAVKTVTDVPINSYYVIAD